MAVNIEEIISRIPEWAKAGDLKVSPLEGGITNSNFRVDTGGQSYALRIAGLNTEMLGINREHEYAANLAAGQLGIAPEVVYVIQPEGYLVTRFLAARPLPVEEITQQESICTIMEMIRKIHSLPQIPGRFNVFEVVRSYAEIARRHNVPFPENFDRLLERMNEAEAALSSDPEPYHPCHNDLLNANFLRDEKQIYILDWEYAGMGDIFFDLGNFSSNHDLTDEQDRFVLQCYFGKVTEKHLAHFKIMKVLSYLREAMWGLVQIGISELDFDYRSYAGTFFARVFEKINDPDWDHWIKEMKNNG